MSCLLCSEKINHEFERVTSFGYPLIYYQCDHCGLIFQPPGISEAANPEFYAEAYRKIYQSNPEPTAKDLWVQEKRALTLISFLKAVRVESPQRILDIGASTGVLLKAFQNEFESELLGVEPGDAYRSFAESQGIPMVSSLEELSKSKPEKFDLISIIHVLEHLPNPVDTLRLIREELLNESGTLLLEVPNFYTHESYELAHLVCYTPHTLQQTLKQAGYHVFFFQRHGFPRSEVLNLYLTLMAQPLSADKATTPVTKDRLVKVKRDSGRFYRKIVEKISPNRAWTPLPEFSE